MGKIIAIILLLVSACVSCSTVPELVLKFQHRRYRPCSVIEINNYRPATKKPMLFCWRHCTKYKRWRSHVSRNCREWSTDILETREDFEKIRASGFVLINEERIF